MASQKHVIYIEGTTDDTNGDLRQGFSILLSQKLEGKMPRIKMAQGKSQAISKFKRPLPGDNPLLIIDLDNDSSYKGQILKDEELESKSALVFFMVQEMEAWFLSQPNILDQFYNSQISSKVKRTATDIGDPSDELIRLTRQTKKGKYHKVNHGVDLLKKLDLSLLMSEFEDVKRLIETLDKS